MDDCISISSIPAVCQRLKDAFKSHSTLSYEWRMNNLKALQNMITQNRQSLIEAVRQDLGKGVDFEVVNSEINLPLTELKETIHHLKKWMSPDKVMSNLVGIPCSSYVYKAPRGTVLIISPWNYPINLALIPLMGAIAAGCTVFLKLSRQSVKTSSLLEKLIRKYLDSQCIAVEYVGGAPVITALVKEKWDHVFFTGSVDVGRVVYEAAAKTLTPVTLELGGKNPCIVTNDANIELAARRIVWGKFYNNGQTCITADYVLVQKDIVDKLIQAIKFYLVQFFGQDPKQSLSYSRIINEKSFDRLVSLLKEGDIAVGGTHDRASKYIAPTLLTNVKMTSPLMRDEIFGPILPIIPYHTLDEAITFVNSRPLPLALYCFTNNKSVAEEVLLHTRSGGACINDLLVHFTNSRLPFGGVGESGIGHYHGKLTFDTFTHQRAVIKSISSSLLDAPIRYPPYTTTKAILADGLTSGRWVGYVSQFAQLCGVVSASTLAYLYLKPPSRL